MKQKIVHFAKKLKNKKVLIPLLIVLAIAAFFALKGNQSNAETVTVSLGEFRRAISVSGKVVPAQEVDLAFETGGTVTAVYKKAGDPVAKGEAIASLNTSELSASRAKAQADLEAAEAELLKLKSGESNSSEVEADKQEAVNAIIDAYTDADDAVRNKVDQYFDEPRGPYPKIRYTFEDYYEKKDAINDGRELVEDVLIEFEAMADSISVSNFTPEKLEKAKRYISSVKDFLSLISSAVNSFESSDTLSQTTIDKYRSDLSLARSSVNGAYAELTESAASLRSTTSNIPVEEARVRSAAASVRSYDAQIAKMIIRAPFTGVMSLQDAKVGQSVSANSTVAGLISAGYEAEVFVPEVSIPGIQVGNTAEVELDAYPGEAFAASVTYIDPAETEKDGVSNYKVKLTFDNPDARVRSGMTTDVNIIVETRSAVLLIPERAVITEGGLSYVFLKGEKDPVKTQVTLGEKDGRGNAEVLKGLSDGAVVLLNPPKE